MSGVRRRPGQKGPVFATRPAPRCSSLWHNLTALTGGETGSRTGPGSRREESDPYSDASLCQGLALAQWRRPGGGAQSVATATASEAARSRSRRARSAFEPDSESFARGASAPATRSLSAPTAGTTCQCRLSESSVVVWLNLNGEPGVSPASG